MVIIHESQAGLGNLQQECVSEITLGVGRIYRDPVHNIVRLRTDTGEGELMMHLIDTPEFQRLQRINSETCFS